MEFTSIDIIMLLAGSLLFILSFYYTYNLCFMKFEIDEDDDADRDEKDVSEYIPLIESDSV